MFSACLCNIYICVVVLICIVQHATFCISYVLYSPINIVSSSILEVSYSWCQPMSSCRRHLLADRLLARIVADHEAFVRDFGAIRLFQVW